jgi:hypothetical protein
VRNEHVIDIHAVEGAGERPYIVMEYIAGVSLQQRLDQTGSLEIKEVLRIGMQIAAGLAAAHAQGLVHRDIKPANILLENSVERVKLTDFGLARAVDDASLTQRGVVAGTPQYMAPEQARGESVDHRADLFSLGSVLYAMCTGQAPFQAGGMMAVLKRVCETTPRPIPEINPEIPDWLVAIINRLHVKDPAGRFQSAAEAAELLGQHLDHLRQPERVPRPGGITLHRQSAWMARGRRWAVVAAVILLLAGLGMTEATGVTNLSGTVIRILVPDGTLVVEVDDPSVKVTIEGDGGIVIRGAGLEEIRLRPGIYKVQADRDGKSVPLERELVSIAKSGREVVRVKLDASAAQAAAKAEKSAFVVLGRKGVAERKFDTLAEAVLATSNGGTIEVRGNGPFISQPVDIRDTALSIRAGNGFHPVIALSPEPTEGYPHLLQTDAPLVLEGLEFQAARPKSLEASGRVGIAVGGSSFHAANCQFHFPRRLCVWLTPQTSRCAVRNCAFWTSEGSGALVGTAGGQWLMDNCVHLGDFCAVRTWIYPGCGNVSIRIAHCSLLTRNTIWLDFDGKKPITGQTAQMIRLEVRATILDSHTVLHADRHSADGLSLEVFHRLLPRLLSWRGQQNVYAARNYTGNRFVQSSIDGVLTSTRGPKDLAAWNQLWTPPETGSVQGRIRYRGGNLLGKLATDVIAPAEFRLLPDSAGYRAGKDGKDLGADIDLVGPGSAYERWKKTPQYQQWLKETGQLK